LNEEDQEGEEEAEPEQEAKSKGQKFQLTKEDKAKREIMRVRRQKQLLEQEALQEFENEK